MWSGYTTTRPSAVVWCVDEKRRIQALVRSQLALPMMPGMPERRTHDGLRHGVTSLFAAFSIEFRKFLVRMDKAVPADLDVHLVCGNYTTHNRTRRTVRRGCRLAARRTDAPDGSGRHGERL
jgi:hypothetical protein